MNSTVQISPSDFSEKYGPSCSPSPLLSSIQQTYLISSSLKELHPLNTCLGVRDAVNTSVSFSINSDGAQLSLSKGNKSTDNERRVPDTVVAHAYKLQENWSHDLGHAVVDATEFGSVCKLAVSLIENRQETASFLLVNLTAVIDQHAQWKKLLPMVEPFYAVKCHPDPVILRLLASLGCGFDCASKSEIDLVVNGLGQSLSFGASGLAAKNIVYANPAKMTDHIRFAAESHVRMTVFDGEDELAKIASTGAADQLDLLLRISTDDKSSKCPFSNKFGCPVEDAPRMLQIAKSLGLRVVGVSFHVGSGCGDAAVYSTALEHSLHVFQAGEALGMPAMTVVDIGGGFPGYPAGYAGDGMPTFAELAATIRDGIVRFNSQLVHGAHPNPSPMADEAATKTMPCVDRPPVRFIAEPGRYFVTTCTAVTTRVIARKGGAQKMQALYLDNGVYGTFNNVIYDHAANPVPHKLSIKATNSQSHPCHGVLGTSPVGGENTGSVGLACDGVANEENEDIPSAVFGPTCDGLDQMCSQDSTKLPRCEIGDWLFWEHMGAYTHTASFAFNGYTHVPFKTYCMM